jgi:hypothetical protein
MAVVRHQGGSRLALLTSSEPMRKSLNGLNNPTPESGNHLRYWNRGVVGGLLLALVVVDIVLDVHAFDPLHPSVSIADGIASIETGRHMFRNSISK